MKMTGWIVAASLAGVSPVLAEHPTEHPKEHPAQPTQTPKTEHPKEHPEERSKTTAPAPARSVTMAELEKAIIASRKGTTEIQDPVTKKKLKLRLVKVHRDKLARISTGTYFACADFKATDGKIYDLDVFMKGDSPESLVETEVTLHKKQGKPRYNWVEKDGLWSKAPVKKKK